MHGRRVFGFRIFHKRHDADRPPEAAPSKKDRPMDSANLIVSMSPHIRGRFSVERMLLITIAAMGIATVVVGWYVAHLWNREVVLYERGFSYRQCGLRVGDVRINPRACECRHARIRR